MSLKASISQLDWHGVSQSFDNTAIQMTRPGFGMIAIIAADQIVHRLRNKIADKLLLRTRDQLMHMTIFQVFLMFNKDYDSNSLPPNLLKVFQDYIYEQLQSEIQKVMQNINKKIVQVTNEWLILGKDMPSHVVIRVYCKQLDEFLLELKHKANELGHEWMSVLAEELQLRKRGGEMKINPTGMMVQSKGWSLIIGYTANADYKTHVTLGVLPTGDSEMDDLLKLQHQDIDRVINPTFSSEQGDPKLTNIAIRYSECINRVQIKRLKELCEEDIQSYPHLVEQVMRAKQGQSVVITRIVIDEWGRYLLSTFGDLISTVDDERTLHISGIQSNMINMDRMQNFE